jgi:hypothetical protein
VLCNASLLGNLSNYSRKNIYSSSLRAKSYECKLRQQESKLYLFGKTAVICSVLYTTAWDHAVTDICDEVVGADYLDIFVELAPGHNGSYRYSTL